jgi:hypothetical protein
MIKRTLILLPLSFLFAFSLFAQGGEATAILGKGKVVYQNHIYWVNAPYFTMGYGAGYGFRSNKPEQNMTIAYHHFIKKIGLSAGYHSSSDEKIWWRSNQKLNELFVSIGQRWESTKFEMAAFAGPSYAYGSYPVPIVKDTVTKMYPYRFKELGLRAELTATYKFAYDLGVGLSLYGTVNKQYSVAGMQIHLFFSTAFIRDYN